MFTFSSCVSAFFWTPGLPTLLLAYIAYGISQYRSTVSVCMDLPTCSQPKSWAHWRQMSTCLSRILRYAMLPYEHSAVSGFEPLDDWWISPALRVIQLAKFKVSVGARTRFHHHSFATTMQQLPTKIVRHKCSIIEGTSTAYVLLISLLKTTLLTVGAPLLAFLQCNPL